MHWSCTLIREVSANPSNACTCLANGIQDFFDPIGKFLNCRGTVSAKSSKNAVTVTSELKMVSWRRCTRRCAPWRRKASVGKDSTRWRGKRWCHSRRLVHRSRAIQARRWRRYERVALLRVLSLISHGKQKQNLGKKR